MPEFPDRTERLRDPKAGFVAYVPPGTLEKGKALVTTGGGRTIQCGTCHGAHLQGMGDVPPIADRTVSYAVRQLYNYQQGMRHSQVMRPLVAKLSPEDMSASPPTWRRCNTPGPLCIVCGTRSARVRISRSRHPAHVLPTPGAGIACTPRHDQHYQTPRDRRPGA
ncbi:MAG: c-type cytochrome [Vicinamibacterales bacterium]